MEASDEQRWYNSRLFQCFTLTFEQVSFPVKITNIYSVTSFAIICILLRIWRGHLIQHFIESCRFLIRMLLAFLCFIISSFCLQTATENILFSPKMRPHVNHHLFYSFFLFYPINKLTFDDGRQLTNKNWDSVSYVVISCDMPCA